MEDLKVLIDVLVDLMQMPFTIWGYDLSWWDIMLSTMVGGIVIYLIARFFND